MDELLEGPLDVLAFRRRLLQQHEERLLAVDYYHIAAAGANSQRCGASDLLSSDQARHLPELE
jgi:hypothetical protein